MRLALKSSKRWTSEAGVRFFFFFLGSGTGVSGTSTAVVDAVPGVAMETVGGALTGVEVEGGAGLDAAVGAGAGAGAKGSRGVFASGVEGFFSLPNDMQSW